MLASHAGTSLSGSTSKNPSDLKSSSELNVPSFNQTEETPTSNMLVCLNLDSGISLSASSCSFSPSCNPPRYSLTISSTAHTLPVLNLTLTSPLLLKNSASPNTFSVALPVPLIHTSSSPPSSS